MIKKIIFYFRPFLRVLLCVFYEKKYLSGRYFENSFIGYKWALKSILHRNILRLDVPTPWPVNFTCSISNPKNITFHIDDIRNFQSPGLYIQNFKAHIYIGKGSYIAPNVGLITANHNINNLDVHEDGKDINIGKKCWIGMNSVILPGVILGDRTIVAAGSVVTKSFPEGNAVIGGVPAKFIKKIKEYE